MLSSPSPRPHSTAFQHIPASLPPNQHEASHHPSKILTVTETSIRRSAAAVPSQLRPSSHPPQQRINRYLRPQHRHLPQYICIELRSRRDGRPSSRKVRRQQQSTHSLQRQRTLDPSQQIQSRHHHRRRSQRNPNRKFKSPIATRCNVLQLRRQHLAKHPVNLHRSPSAPA